MSDGLCLSRGTCNREVCLGFGPCCGLGLSSNPWGDGDLSRNHRSCSRFLSVEVLNFSPNFLVVHIHLNRCYGLACARNQNLMCFLHFCCTWLALSFCSHLWFFFADPTCGSVAPLLYRTSRSCHTTPPVFSGVFSPDGWVASLCIAPLWLAL
jgi:hypothetical protein